MKKAVDVVEGYFGSTRATLALLTHWVAELGGSGSLTATQEKASARLWLEGMLETNCVERFRIPFAHPAGAVHELEISDRGLTVGAEIARIARGGLDNQF